MPNSAADALLLPPEFPRAGRYDVDWQVQNAVGPNPLWLLEPLCERMHLREGMRVLDLGCGRAATSIFLAREFGVSVCAADLWIAPSDNARRIEEAGVADRVLPLRVEAHALPFAQEWFDAVFSIDAYHYFGTDALYLSQLVPHLRPGGRLGICVPGTVRELGDEFPSHLKVQFTGADLGTFRTPQWLAALGPGRGGVRRTGASRVGPLAALGGGLSDPRTRDRALAGASTGVGPGDVDRGDHTHARRGRRPHTRLLGRRRTPSVRRGRVRRG